MANLLITGGAGCIGTVIGNLALQQGHEVKVVDALWFKKDIPLLHNNNANYKFVKGDIRNGDFTASLLEGVDFVIHTAAVVGEPAAKKFPELTYQINYKSSLDLISKASEYGVKGLIFLSTCSNYGTSGDAADEKAPLKPLSLYAETKVDVERYLMDKVTNLDWIICRLSTVYGVSPRMRFDLTVNDFTMNAYMEKYLDVFLPFTYRPYIHVRDVARVIIEMLARFEKVKNNIFNVGFNGENYQKINIAEIVKKYVPELKIEIVKKGTDLRDYKVDFSKIQRFLNIRNTFTVEKGIREVLELLKDQRVKDPYNSCYYNTSPDFGGE